eukprot:CAMPEP_0113672094 /NCGR_PEP_ID=MMETSP0038_2-20120614/6069_1 /TAXON_ID=2898 /ORGANISM="Cryptomonas paramecium" /LENGTH=91 /DNA_ID=CAMNT_0000588319 /DNA_START=12 /DNA_END=287 /DNA_ORIENTATION=- /assembly_acc=CAM_ASM_000170
MFSDVRQFDELLKGGGLGMGTSSVSSCPSKYLRTEGGIKVCADGNATDSWDDPWKGGRDGWGFYDNGFSGPFDCPADSFCEKPYKNGLGTY